MYVELLQHGLTRSYREFIQEIVKHGKFVMRDDWCFYFDTVAFVRKWRDVAAGPLLVESYESAVADRGVVPTFLSSIGAPESVIQLGRDAKRLNKRNRYPETVPVLPRLLGSVRLWRRFEPFRENSDFRPTRRGLIASELLDWQHASQPHLTAYGKYGCKYN